MTADQEDAAIQRALDKTPPEQMPRTHWGLRAMLASEGLKVTEMPKTTSKEPK